MATGYYLLDNKQRKQQYLTKRRNGRKVTGTFDVHTWESAPDWVGADTGLENAIPYLLQRTDYGSYHSANDSDSTRPLVPWWMEAFHDRFTNNFAVGVSICTQAHKWPQAPKVWREAAVKRAAQEAARIADEIYLCTDLTKVASLKIDAPAVWLTQAQAHAGKPGFVRHGTSDPGRRSDPWPADAPEGELFLTHYKAARKTGRYATTKTTTTKSEEDDMATYAEQLDYIQRVVVENQRRFTEKVDYLTRVTIENQRRITETRSMVEQIAEATGTEIDYDKVQHAAEAGIRAALEAASGALLPDEVTYVRKGA